MIRVLSAVLPPACSQAARAVGPHTATTRFLMEDLLTKMVLGNSPKESIPVAYKNLDFG